MMSEEHQLAPIQRQQALRSALIVGLAAIIGSFIPLMPYFFLPVGISMVLSILVAALALFLTGAYKARVTIGHPVHSGLELAAIGIASALVGYAVGVLFKVPMTP
ncbi:MAG: hypothetical protein EXR62_15955 [Chloroflexi bacterium]|nr:hypothetical protein [Chloroflexota bacterium]